MEVDLLEIFDVFGFHVRLDVEDVPRHIGLIAAVDLVEVVAGGHGVYAVAEVHRVADGPLIEASTHF